MFYIGNVKIENNLILAPMAGVSNAAFRVLSRKNGAGLSYAEMVSDKGLVYENEKTFNLLKSHPEEHPYAQQIFGSEITSMVKAAKLVNDYSNCDIIDLNMGCPVPKVASRAQAGAGLLKNPNKIYEIVKEIKKVIKQGNIPDVIQYSSYTGVGFFRIKNIPAVIRLSSIQSLYDEVVWLRR